MTSKSRAKRVEIQRTHWATCWKDPAHHECTLALVQRLRILRERDAEKIERWYSHARSLAAMLKDARALQCRAGSKSGS